MAAAMLRPCRRPCGRRRRMARRRPVQAAGGRGVDAAVSRLVSAQAGGAQRSLEEALVSWWSDGRLLAARRSCGVRTHDARSGIDVEESHRSLLLRSASTTGGGMLTASSTSAIRNARR
ncbi:MAG: hypothetical protein R2838_26045 [Caldilineaceae bacterium]